MISGMHTEPPHLSELRQAFEEINRSHFDGFLEAPTLRWNSRLRSSAGRFFPGFRRLWKERPAAIEIASYLCEEPNSSALIRDTLAHEMIHYWLWIRRRPYGHTLEFSQKLKLMGVSRYNTVPRQRPYKYVYTCRSCAGEFKARRKLGPLACARCCKTHNGGRYDPRFRLELTRRLAHPDGGGMTAGVPPSP
jgi:SprT-like protein